MRVKRIWLKNVGPFPNLDLIIPDFENPALADCLVVIGPNGSGKTTLLYAIATVLSGIDQLGKRWSDGSCVAVQCVLPGGRRFEDDLAPTNSFTILASKGPEGGQLPPWEVAEPSASVRTSIPGSVSHSVWGNASDAVLKDLLGNSSGSSHSSVVGPLFCYGAFRRLETPGSLFIQDSPLAPMAQAALFEKSVTAGSFEQWVANTRTKLALAREDNDLDGVQRYERILARVEQVITQLIGRAFSLRVNREPLSVVGVIDGTDIPLHLMPDGFRSAVAWFGDVIRRLDLLEREPGCDATEMPCIILLDEIDAHLHPEWQRKLLYIVERLLPNAQLILSTHSPFIVQSAGDSSIVQLSQDGTANILSSQSGEPIDVVLNRVLGVESDYGPDIQAKLSQLVQIRDQVLRRELDISALVRQADPLAKLSESLDLALGIMVADVRSRLS
jgi:energy-coupling factor transporter ATP-binding protein EcfA2